MNEFETKWKACVGRAKDAPDFNDAAPYGFAARVVAVVAGAERRGEAVPLELIMQRLTLRSLALVGALVLVCAAFELPHFRDRRPLEPGIENTVAQLLWTL